MGRIPWVMYLWPGLPQIARQGTWSALAVAAAFAVAVNLALAATLVWDELLTPAVRSLVWIAIGLMWAGSAAISYIQVRGESTPRDTASVGNSFDRALDHYLKGNWFEAEHALASLLHKNPRDLDAMLMLATLMRHTGRYEEAESHLDRLERFDGSEKWELEISREREIIHEARITDPAGTVATGPPNEASEAA